MVKKRKIPNYSCYDLADRFCSWLKNVNCSPIFGRNLAPAGPNYVQRSTEEPGVYMKLTSENVCVQQIFYFRNTSREDSLPTTNALSKLEIEIFTVDPEGDVISYYELLSNQRKKFSKQELKKYRSIFGEPSINFDQKEFVFSPMWKEHFTGIKINIPLKKIPLGSGRKLSDNLFKYLESGIAKPIRKGTPKETT